MQCIHKTIMILTPTDEVGLAAARQEQAYRASKGQNQYTTSEKMEPGKLNK